MIRKKILFTAIIMVIALTFLMSVSANFANAVDLKVYTSQTSPNITVTEIAELQYKYHSIGQFHDGLALAERDGQAIGVPHSGTVFLDANKVFIDKTGKEVIGLNKVDQVRDFNEGMAAVSVKVAQSWYMRRWGYVNTKGEIIAPFDTYDTAKDFNEGLALVGIRPYVSKGVEKFGFIDKAGKVVIPIEYWNAQSFSEGLSAVQKEENGKWGFINKDGKVIIPFEYFYVQSFSDGLAAVQKEKNGKWGFIDKSGKVVIPIEYFNVQNFSEGLVAVQKEIRGKCGFIDKTNKVVIDFKYDTYSGYLEDCYFKNGIANVYYKKNEKDMYGKYVYIDRNGKIINNSEDSISYFSEGLAINRKEVTQWNYKKGYINQKGEQILPFLYDLAEPFSHGVAAVRTQPGTSGYIDRQGNYIVPLGVYDYTSSFSEGLAIVARYGNKWAILEIVAE